MRYQNQSFQLDTRGEEIVDISAGSDHCMILTGAPYYSPLKEIFISYPFKARGEVLFAGGHSLGQFGMDLPKSSSEVLPPPGNIGNEPHHCSINADSKVLMCTGLLSLLSGQNGIFIFDISDRRHPRFLFSTSTVLSSIADDVLPLPNGGFLVTMMGSATGGSPGRIAEFDRCMRLVAEHPSNPPNGFNPHGIHMRTDINVVASSDFLVPATSLIGFPGGLALSSTVRFFDYPSFDQLAVVSLPVAPTLNGTLDVKFILGDSDARAVTSNTFSGQLWTVDPNSNTATLATA